ncbi:hypothetical protein C5167_004623 [Papaver somniferum]|uniref:Uncharacterized protein n=1 Tax=Papaver somniferum TaxID=3469 RepID=A0A4Y7J852_PAPSO|nr:hypothetical protein C5167_004623 [Papaver somniferum]
MMLNKKSAGGGGDVVHSLKVVGVMVDAVYPVYAVCGVGRAIGGIWWCCEGGMASSSGYGAGDDSVGNGRN